MKEKVIITSQHDDSSCGGTKTFVANASCCDDTFADSDTCSSFHNPTCEGIAFTDALGVICHIIRSRSDLTFAPIK